MRHRRDRQRHWALGPTAIYLQQYRSWSSVSFGANLFLICGFLFWLRRFKTAIIR